MADKEPNEAHEPADTYHRHGVPDPSSWDEADAVTGRPADKPTANNTFADRAKGTRPAKAIDVDDAENKAVSSGTTKVARARKPK